MALTQLTDLQPTNIKVTGIATFDQTVGIAGTLTYQDVTNVDSVGILTARSDINALGNIIITNAAPKIDLVDSDVSSTATLLGNSGNIFYSTSSSNRDHIFRGSSTEVVRITGDSKVGIGTDNPLKKIHIYNETASATGDVLVSNVVFAANQDKPYLTVGTKDWTGATTNWNTFGFQHRIKTDSGGTPRVTIDSSAGLQEEKFCVENTGKVGIGTDNPAQLLDIASTAPNIRFTDTVDGHSEIDGNAASLKFNADKGNAKADTTITFAVDNSERLRIDSTGSVFAGGTPLTESDLNWGHDTYQRPHIFSGITGGSPADGAIVSASAAENPSDARIGAFIFGCKTSSSTGVVNSGLKAYIECYTNTNVSDAWKTGGYLRFSTRPDNGNPTERVRIDSSGHVLPATNNTYDLGSTSLGWRNVYMNDLNLSNMKGNTNDVDGTQGSWTIQEGKDDLYIINRLNGKKFKIKMEEIS